MPDQNLMPDQTPARFVSLLESVLPEGVRRPVQLHEPEFSVREKSLVTACIDSGWVSSAGKYVEEFETRLAEFTGARHAIAVSSGTAALHAALLVAGVKPGDEVLVPTLTFVATANAVAHCGATPHFADSDENGLGIDPHALADYLHHAGESAGTTLRNRTTGRRISAIVPMHTFGHPVDMQALLSVAARCNIPVIEDAAESLGSRIGDRHTGTFGVAGALSFNGNKIITTGGGGAVITDDAGFAARLRSLTTTAKRQHPWAFYHDEVAFNYRMPNINAALGCAQMEKLPELLRDKRELAAAYLRAFSGFAAGACVPEAKGATINYWLNTFRLNTPDAILRDKMLEAAHAAGIHCRPAWELNHRLPMFTGAPRAPLPAAERLADSLISLPSSAFLAPRRLP